MSAEVSLGWNDAKLRAGAKGAAAIVEANANRMKSALDGIGQGFGAGLGFGAFSAGASIIKQMAGEVAAATVDMDSLRLGMTALEGSTAGANQRLEELRNLAKSPGLGFEQVIQGDITLRNAGLSAQQASRGMREIGNALAVVGKGKAELDAVLTSLQQIKSTGKIDAANIKEIAARVPQLRSVMKDAFGTADGEALQKMGLSFDEFFDRLIAGFEKKIPRAIVGLQGKIDNFTDAVTGRLADFGEAFTEGLVGNLEDSTARLEELSQTAKGAGATLGTFTGGVIEVGKALGGVAKFSLDGLGQLGSDLTKAQLDMLGFQRVVQPTVEELNKLRKAENQAAMAADELARKQRESADATRKAAEASAAATLEANKQARAQAELTAKIVAKTNAARDAYMTERQQTADAYLTTEQKIERTKEKILEIEGQLNATIGQRGGEEISYKLLAEKEKLMQSLIGLSQQFNAEQEKSNSSATKDTGKRQEYDYALGMFDLELAILDAKAAGHTKQVERLEREKAIIEESARIAKEMGTDREDALQKATRLVDAQNRADGAQNGEGGRRKIRGYSQDQGGVSDAISRANGRNKAARGEYTDSVNRHFGTFSEVDAAQKQKFSGMFGNAPAENAPATKGGGVDELTASWSEWGQKTLELWEKAFQ